MRSLFISSEKKERITLSFLSGASSLVAFFFIARHIPGVPQWIALLPRDFFLAALPSSAIALLAGIFFFNPIRAFRLWIPKALLLVFPSIIFFAIAWHIRNDIPDTAKIFVTFYGFIVAAFGFFRWFEKTGHLLHQSEAHLNKATVSSWFRNQGPARIAIVIALSGVFFGFAAHDLGKSANVDEALWLYGRIPKYWNALESLEFQKTSISDKPGITIAIISGSGLAIEGNPLSWKSLRGNDRGIDEFFFVFRIPIVAAIAVLLPLFYFFLERIGGRTRALFAFMLIALSPTTIGMAKIVNPDALLWVFAPLSLFAYLAYFRHQHLGFLIFSGILLGFALLTKYVANILFVFMLGTIFLEYIIRNNKEPFLPYLKRSLSAYAFWTFSALATFFVFFPATWLKPEKLLEATIFSQAFESTAFLFLSFFTAILVDRLLNQSRATEWVMQLYRSQSRLLVAFIATIWGAFLLFVFWNTLSGMRLYDFPALLAAPKTILENSSFFGVYTANFYPLLFGIHPITAAALLAASPFLFKKHSIKTSAGKTVLYGITFIMLYYLGSSINGVGSITRYQIMLFPIAAASAGFIIGSTIKRVQLPRFVKQAAIVLVLACSIWTLFSTPFPLSYASTLLPNRYHTDVKDMGPGSYEAAEYLNSLPNAMNLVVWSDKDGVCKFFVGRCKSGFSWDAYENLTFDYIVVSSARESRTDKRVGVAVEDARKDVIRFDTYYDRTDTPAWELLINGRPSHFVKIYPFER